MSLSDRSLGAAPPHRVPIEVVEPTLVSEAGHCAALFCGLRAAAPEMPFRIWVDRTAHLAGWDESITPLRPIFHRRWRKIEAWMLYRRLLRSGAPILVPTASYFDLRALDLAAGAPIPANRAHLYFHKLRASEGRLGALARMAQRQPALELFGTSEEIVQRLRSAGFAQVRRVLPVLTASAAAPGAGAAPFRHLLSAGAARADKGFGRIVDLVEEMKRSQAGMAITVQTSGDHYGRYDERTLADVQRLGQVGYGPLQAIAATLDAGQYAALFPGAVCLQPYSPGEYADKMSAVTFDALRAGAPVITLAGTTMAGIVTQTGAGIVVPDAEPATLLQAACAAVEQYPQLQAKALAAAALFAPAQSWAPMVERLRLATHAVPR